MIRQAYSGFAIIMMAVLVRDKADSWLVSFVCRDVFVSWFGFGAMYQMEESEGICI